MFGTLGGPELILILVVALIVFGPRRLPEIGKSMGKMLAEFRKASNDFKRTIEDEIEAEKARPPEPPPALEAAAPVEPDRAPALGEPASAEAAAEGPATTEVAAPLAEPLVEPHVEAPSSPTVSRETPSAVEPK
jgi:TatA/E family protein of Tat protein translocase